MTPYWLGFVHGVLSTYTLSMLALALLLRRARKDWEER